MKSFSFHRILGSRDQIFLSSWDLYCSSFPEVERRSLVNLSNVLGNPLFHADIIFQEEHFIGLLFWWKFEDFRYMEHFAICPEKRGQGVGTKILTHFKEQSTFPTLLEVEPGETDMARRRIKFYESNHFHLHTFPYIQPPYSLDSEPIPLQIMSYPKPLPIETFNAFVKTIHQKVYQFLH